jgi:hypothetical protein
MPYRITRGLNDAALSHGVANVNSMIARGLLVAGLIMSAGPAFSAGSDDGFAAFWTEFKAAVSKSDQNAVSQMIKFPVLYNDIRQVSEFPAIW